MHRPFVDFLFLQTVTPKGAPHTNRTTPRDLLWHAPRAQLAGRDGPLSNGMILHRTGDDTQSASLAPVSTQDDIEIMMQGKQVWTGPAAESQIGHRSRY